MDFNFQNRVPDRARILVAMSGGVDSSVAAGILSRSGCDVVGITMHLVSGDDRPRSGAQVSGDKACCSLSMSEDARRVSNELGIPHYVINLADEFKSQVVEPSRLEYSRGRTPNPCILCNRWMKFDVLFKRADALGCDFIATGHYARTGVDTDGYHLYRGIDAEKDQSYFLAYLTEKELRRIIFPLGETDKSAVRDHARAIGLVTADRPESQDLCFFASGEFPEEWRDGVEISVGKFVTKSGEIVGQHDGINRFTVGQRKGLPGGMAEKMYVIGIDPESNSVIIGTEDECYSSEFTLEDVSLVSEKRSHDNSGKKFGIQVRYRSKPVEGEVELSKNRTGRIKLDERVRAVTPGQAAVWYSGDEVIGAGTINAIVG